MPPTNWPSDSRQQYHRALWESDRERYKRRHEVERLFQRLKGFRRIFSRFDKLDALYFVFIQFTLIFEALR